MNKFLQLNENKPKLIGVVKWDRDLEVDLGEKIKAPWMEFVSFDVAYYFPQNDRFYMANYGGYTAVTTSQEGHSRHPEGLAVATGSDSSADGKIAIAPGNYSCAHGKTLAIGHRASAAMGGRIVLFDRHGNFFTGVVDGETLLPHVTYRMSLDGKPKPIR